MIDRNFTMVQAFDKLKIQFQAATRRKWGFQILQTGLGMVIFQVISFLAGLLVARGLGPAGQGKFQLLMSITVFTIGLAKLGLDEGIAYLVPQYRVHSPGKVSPLIVYALIVSFAVSVLLGGVFYVASTYLADYLLTLPGFAVDLKYAVVLLPTLMLLLMSMAVLRGIGRADLRAYMYYYVSSLSFLALVVSFSYGELTTGEAYIARTLSYAVAAAIALVLVLRFATWKGWTLSWIDIRSVHSFSILLVFIGMFQYVVEQPLVDLAIVGRFASAETVGVYAVAARIAALVAIAANAMAVVMAPALAETAARSDSGALLAQYQRASEWMARLSLFSAGCIWLLRHEILGLFGPAYQSGELFLAILVVGQAISGLMGLNTPLLLASGYTGVEFALTGVASILMVIGGLLLGKLYGAVGVAVATAGSTVLLAFARRRASKSFCKMTKSGTIARLLPLSFFGVGVSIIVQNSMLMNQMLTSLSSVVLFSCIFWGLGLVLQLHSLEHKEKI